MRVECSGKVTHRHPKCFPMLSGELTCDVRKVLFFFTCPQVRLVSELGKIESSFRELEKMKLKNDVGQYSIEIIELF